MESTKSVNCIAHVHHHPGSDSIMLQFPLLGTDRQLVRQINEELSRILVRIERLVNPTPKKRDTKYAAKLGKPTAKAVTRAAAVIQFKTSTNEIIPPTQLLGDALLAASYLEIDQNLYQILHNQPRVKEISVVNKHFEGVPIVPTAQMDFCTIETCTWTWHRGEILLGTKHIYTPTALDIGHKLTIKCIPPAIDGDSSAYGKTTETNSIMPCPDRSVFAARQALGRLPSSENGLRIMTYNILYDKYARADREVNRMYPYAAPGILHEDYRMPLVALEVFESGADLICFQEMGESICRSYFNPLFESQGFAGHYAGKGGTTPEGCAIFCRSSKFSLLDGQVFKYATLLRSEREGSPLSSFLHNYPQVAMAVRQVPSIVQMVTLEATNDSHDILLVVNTHKFYRHDANIVRLVQTILLTQQVEVTMKVLEEKYKRPIRLIVAGDLNARPVTSSIEFLLRGKIDTTHPDWMDAHTFRWNDNEVDQSRDAIAAVEPNELKHSLVLQNTIETSFTTYLRNIEFVFQDTLDYILIDPRFFRLVQAFPVFTHEDVDTERSLPSTTFPSDHISLICDLEYTQEGS